MLKTFDISNYEFCYIKDSMFEISDGKDNGKRKFQFVAKTQSWYVRIWTFAVMWLIKFLEKEEGSNKVTLFIHQCPDKGSHLRFFLSLNFSSLWVQFYSILFFRPGGRVGVLLLKGV